MKSKLNIYLVVLLVFTMIFSGCSAQNDGLMGSVKSEAVTGDYINNEPPAKGNDEVEDYPPPDFAPTENAGEKTMSDAAVQVPPITVPDEERSVEQYLTIDENREKYTNQEPMLTFSLKVDTAAYTNVQRYIQSGNVPPKDAVRTEELINYFNYDQPMSFGKDPFSIYTEIGPSPFNSGSYMAFIRVKSKEIDKKELPKSNLTFLIDTSGSMDSYDKLPLLKEAFSLLVETLGEDDRVSIVTYAGSSEIVLDSASGDGKTQIMHAINTLSAGGSTAGADGIKTAYSLAEKNYIEGGNNRVLLATDGDFNVGISNTKDLAKLVEQKKDKGVYLSILGFGTGNIRDDIMETLSKSGSGNYSYINNASTAQKVLVEELGSNLFTIADDVKAQVEFNPQNVKSYRLIGYENRSLKNEDFEDDTKDAGEIGVGTDVVMMFELELHGGVAEQGLKYEQQTEKTTPDFSNEMFEVRIRYKNPGESTSKLMELPIMHSSIKTNPSSDFQFATSVAAFGHLLRNSSYAENVTIDDVIAMAKENLGDDNGGYRKEHLALLQEYKDMCDGIVTYY